MATIRTNKMEWTTCVWGGVLWKQRWFEKCHHYVGCASGATTGTCFSEILTTGLWRVYCLISFGLQILCFLLLLCFKFLMSRITSGETEMSKMHIFAKGKKKSEAAFCHQKARPSPELSAMAAEAGESGEGPTLLEEAVPWLEQPPTGETARLRSNRSTEGSRGLRRLTGQKAEPPWGVKFTLLRSGQEEMRAGLGWCGALSRERRVVVRNQRSHQSILGLPQISWLPSVCGLKLCNFKKKNKNIISHKICSCRF